MLPYSSLSHSPRRPSFLFHLLVHSSRIVWEGEVQVLSKDKKKLEEAPIVQCMVCNDVILIYQEIDETEEQKSKKSGIGGFFKATSGKLTDSNPSVKVYLFGACVSLTLVCFEHFVKTEVHSHEE